MELFEGTTTGRYIQSIDERAVSRDHGASCLNLEAMRSGVPSAASGKAILAWMDHGFTELVADIRPGDPSVTVAPCWLLLDPCSMVTQSFLAKERSPPSRRSCPPTVPCRQRQLRLRQLHRRDHRLPSKRSDAVLASFLHATIGLNATPTGSPSDLPIRACVSLFDAMGDGGPTPPTGV